MRIDADLMAEFARFNAGIARARRAYEERDVPVFDDCLDLRCGTERTCWRCRRRARDLLTVATSEEECAELLAIIDRPGVRDLHGCGTTGGYMRHRRRRETPCDECSAAQRAYWREYRRKRCGKADA